MSEVPERAFAERQLDAYQRLAGAIVNFDLVKCSKGDFRKDFIRERLSLLRVIQGDRLLLDSATINLFDEIIYGHMKAGVNPLLDDETAHQVYRELCQKLTRQILPTAKKFLTIRYDL